MIRQQRIAVWKANTQVVYYGLVFFWVVNLDLPTSFLARKKTNQGPRGVTLEASTGCKSFWLRIILFYFYHTKSTTVGCWRPFCIFGAQNMEKGGGGADHGTKLACTFSMQLLLSPKVATKGLQTFFTEYNIVEIYC